MSEHSIVGIVVNPKLKKPVLVAYDGDEIEIWSMERGGLRIGMGSYEQGDETYLKPSYVTGLPRVHTPSGVLLKGKGYGTSLYTGLCVGAHLNYEGDLQLGLDYDGDGVCSDSESRSSSADKWWRMAVRLRLADDVEDEHTEEGIEFEHGDLECTHPDGDVSVDFARGDLSRTIRANAYYWESATNADLVVAVLEGIELRSGALVETKTSGTAYEQAAMSGGPRGDRRFVHSMTPGGYRNIWKALVEHDDASYVDRDALLALDMRNMEPQAVNLLSTIATIDGIDDEDIDTMRMRAERGLDPETPIRQMRLQFKENPSREREIKSALAETKELRSSLDWKRLSSLP